MAFCRYRSITVQYLRECDINKILPTSFKRWYALRLTPEVRVIFWRPPSESFFFIFRSIVRLNPVVIRYCVINLAPFQEITTAFIISKNGCVHARCCTRALFWFYSLIFIFLVFLFFYSIWCYICFVLFSSQGLLFCFLPSRDANRFIHHRHRSPVVHAHALTSVALSSLRVQCYLC